MNPALIELVSHGYKTTVEYRWLNRNRMGRPLVVFLHEGLGSLAMWRDFPDILCSQGDFRGLVYSRAGYGKSSAEPAVRKYRIDYMHHEAKVTLPALFKALAFDETKPVLFGHSDGASIALIYASLFPHNVSAVIALAPHYYVEEKAIRGIEETGRIYRKSDMKSKLGRYHDNPDLVFWRWHDAWLSEPFRDWNIEKLLSEISCPVLAIQGHDDEYATMRQIDGIKRQAPQTELLKLEKCGHSPHKDQPQIVTSAAMEFIARL
jgi:pimeloyl-ACP methyl ester carboxylesterase